jgi:hypothetical protein
MPPLRPRLLLMAAPPIGLFSGTAGASPVSCWSRSAAPSLTRASSSSASRKEKDQHDNQENQDTPSRDNGLTDCPAGLLKAAVSNRTVLKTIRTLLVWRAIGGDLHDVRVVLGEPGIDAHRVCL